VVDIETLTKTAVLDRTGSLHPPFSQIRACANKAAQHAIYDFSTTLHSPKTQTAVSGGPMNYKFSLTDVADEQVRKAILGPLTEYNTSQAGARNSSPLVITIADEAGEIVGGLWGHTGYEWLFTQLLVVPASHRGMGIGSKLLSMAEGEAIYRGCTGAWLDTFEFQARGFYERMGYTCFAELPNYPTGFSRYFMKKSLRKPSPEA
jgi:GNAT superfamily N-acetyltransferase